MLNATEVELVLAGIKESASLLAHCRVEEMRLEDARQAVKDRATLKLIGTANPLTGKEHSASSAEKLVEQDAEYAAHREKQYAAVRATQMAYADYETAKLRGRYAVDTAVMEA